MTSLPSRRSTSAEQRSGDPGKQGRIERVASQRGCIGPYPCGRGAGANGADLPCDCEAIVTSERLLFEGPEPNVTAVTLVTGFAYVLTEAGELFNEHGTLLGRFGVDDA